MCYGNNTKNIKNSSRSRNSKRETNNNNNKKNGTVTAKTTITTKTATASAKTQQQQQQQLRSSTIITSVCARHFSQCCRAVQFKLPHCHLSNLMEKSPRCPHPQKGQPQRTWKLPPYSASPNTKQGTGTDRTQLSHIFVTLSQHQPIWFQAKGRHCSSANAMNPDFERCSG